MLYTVMPLELVYAEKPPETEEELRGGVRLVWQVSGGTRTLMRVISSDPRDYLKYDIR